MRVLVTGANGLIGSAICARLVTEGHDIRGVVRHDAAPGLHRRESIVLDISQAKQRWPPATRRRFSGP